MTLNRLKKCLPLKTTEFDVAKGIDDEPTFKWWVPYTLRRRDSVASRVNKKISMITHKHGAELPISVAQTKKLDEKTGNNLWMDRINREIKTLKVAFVVLENGDKIKFVHNKASGRLVFYARMTLEWKDRCVKDGRRTPKPKWSTFSRVVSRERVFVLH